MGYLSFEDYLKKYKKQLNMQRLQHDTQYRCVLFHQFGRQYHQYCLTHHLVHQYEDIRYEVYQYEKRMQDYYYRLGDSSTLVVE